MADLLGVATSCDQCRLRAFARGGAGTDHEKQKYVAEGLAHGSCMNEASRSPAYGTAVASHRGLVWHKRRPTDWLRFYRTGAWTRYSASQATASTGSWRP